MPIIAYSVRRMMFFAAVTVEGGHGKEMTFLTKLSIGVGTIVYLLFCVVILFGLLPAPYGSLIVLGVYSITGVVAAFLLWRKSNSNRGRIATSLRLIAVGVTAGAVAAILTAVWYVTGVGNSTSLSWSSTDTIYICTIFMIFLGFLYKYI